MLHLHSRCDAAEAEASAGQLREVEALRGALGLQVRTLDLQRMAASTQDEQPAPILRKLPHKSRKALYMERGISRRCQLSDLESHGHGSRGTTPGPAPVREHG